MVVVAVHVRVWSLLLGGMLLLLAVGGAQGGTSAPRAVSRSFFMGFTPAEYDTGEEAIELTYRFIEKSGDIVTQHFADSVPWVEAFEGRAYHPNLEADLKRRVAHRKNVRKLFLYVSPLTVGGEGLAKYSGASNGMDRPGKWKDKDLDDPEVIQAYLNYCRDLIRRFQPTYMAYAIEVNNLHMKSPNKWPKFLTLARAVYAKLKAEHPSLPVFVSLSVDIDAFMNATQKAQQIEAMRQIMPFTDYIAISVYPYLAGHDDPSRIPPGYFSKFNHLAPGKPFAVAETAFPAEEMRAFGITARGTPQRQDAYLNVLFAQANRLNAKFINWFVPIDYDAYFAKVVALNPGHEIVELFKLWKDAGLVDEAGKPRPSLATWLGWFRRPVRQ